MVVEIADQTVPAKVTSRLKKMLFYSDTSSDKMGFTASNARSIRMEICAVDDWLRLHSPPLVETLKTHCTRSGQNHVDVYMCVCFVC